ncbi:hypothetical protein [Streptomyces sp. enrichment culture]|uniref:hypothetical protein n=1 Tax=Streptomyces sp. enrichment culture TaxID=1795815 RepID=UPI003F57C1C2
METVVAVLNALGGLGALMSGAAALCTALRERRGRDGTAPPREPPPREQPHEPTSPESPREPPRALPREPLSEEEDRAPAGT